MKTAFLYIRIQEFWSCHWRR